MKEQKQLLTKPNSALVMVPKLGKLTPITRKVYNVLLFETQKQAQKTIAAGGIPDARELFSCRLADLTNASSTGTSNTNALAKKYFTEMMDTKVDWESPDSNTGVVWHGMNLLSECKLVMLRSDLWAHWALPPSLLKALTNPDKNDLFTLINLTYMSKLKSYTAIALYEICVRFKHNPNVKGHLTSRNPPEWWVEALTQEPAPIDPVTGLKKRREWRKLKSASLPAAMEEIGQNTDISLELIEHKIGKAVSEIQFLVTKNKIDDDQTVKLPSVNTSLAEQAGRVGISLDALTSFLHGGSSEVEIKFALGKFETRLKDSGLSEIDNKPAYLRSILAEVSGRIRPDQLTVQPPETLQTVTQLLPWVDQRWADVKTEFLALFKAEQNSYIATALRTLKETGMANANMIRKVQGGDLPTGLLLNKAIEAYAVDVYGPDWLAENAVSIDPSRNAEETPQTTNQEESA
jgi:hypothetical protein